MMMQSLNELEEFYRINDPWQYETTPDDIARKETILSEIPRRNYENVLDIGCGHGFITRDLPGEKILGVDISVNAIAQANAYLELYAQDKEINFLQSSLFEVSSKLCNSYDLIVVTGVLYPQYIGEGKILVYKIIDQLLADDGILACCHIDEWYALRFPYLMLETLFFEYREYSQRLEVYVK